MSFLKISGALVLVLLLIPLLTLSLIGFSGNPLLASETYLTLAHEQNIYEELAHELSQETELAFTPQQTEEAFAPLLKSGFSYMLGERDTLNLTLTLPPELLVSTIADTLTQLPPCSSGEDPFTPELHCKPLEKTKEAFAREVIAKQDANTTSFDIDEISPEIKQSLDEVRPYLIQVRTIRTFVYGSTLLLLAGLIFLTLPLRSMFRWIAVPFLSAGILLFVTKSICIEIVRESLTDATYHPLNTFIHSIATLIFSNLTLYGSIALGLGVLGIVASFFLPDAEKD